MKSFINLLESYVNEKCRTNPNLSVRGICLKLGISNSQYVDWLNKRRNIKYSTALEIINNLPLSEDEKSVFIQSAKQIRTKKERIFSEHEIDFLSDPSYMAILVLVSANTKGISLKDIQKQTGQEKSQLQTMMNTLKKLDLVSEQDQLFFPTEQDYAYYPEAPSHAIRKSHKMTLQRVIDNIDHVDMNRREVTSCTVYMDPDKIAELKKRIRKFLFKNAKFSESVVNGKKRELYEINIQMFPWKTDNE